MHRATASHPLPCPHLTLPPTCAAPPFPLQICEDLGYDCATLAAAVTLLDRVLAVLPGAEEVLLPIGVACLRVCANLLEPRAASYADITYRYSHLPLMGVPAFRKLELNLLNNILGWDLTVFTALDMARTCLSLVPVPRIQAVLEPKIEIMHKLALLGESEGSGEGGGER